MVKCEVCQENEACYKCPKTKVRYCSLKCYKNIKPEVTSNSDKSDKVVGAIEPPQEPNSVTETEHKKLDKYQYAVEDARIRELLRHNTVKFHLDKVYRILSVNSIGETTDSSMTEDMKRELAVDYLNTLRTGGIHCNEAIEEFCQLFLELLRERN